VVVHTFPWLDQKVAFNSRPDTARTLPTSLHSAPPCRLADLALAPQLGVGLGTVYLDIELHNVSRAACQLRGVLKVALVDDRGEVWQSTANGPLVVTDGQPEQTIVLLPNSWAMTGPMAVDSSCGGAHLTTRIRVSLPAGTAVRWIPFRIAGHDPELCDLPGTATVHPRPGDLQAVTLLAIPPWVNGAGYDSVRRLTADLEVPPTVRRGSVLKYMLRLSTANEGFTPDGLSPLYEQRLASGPAAGGSYLLRADPLVHLVGAEAVDYRMELRVPDDAPLGPTALTWQFLEPALPALTAPVTIVR
jgi:Protein of unknown function (DUF4232)